MLRSSPQVRVCCSVFSFSYLGQSNLKGTRAKYRAKFRYTRNEKYTNDLREIHDIQTKRCSYMLYYMSKSATQSYDRKTVEDPLSR